MPELRRNIITDDWVIVATERAKRPEDFTDKNRNVSSSVTVSFKENCPFCDGNEGLTPPEVYAVRDGASEANTSGWNVRVVSNKFPALTDVGEVRETTIGIYNTMSGIGAHEVIVETTDYSKSPALLKESEVNTIVDTYVNRYKKLSERKELKYIQIFRNHGKIAGASMEHPHSQIIATPVVPPIVERRLNGAKRYYDHNGKCVFCEILSEEKRDGRRIVFENEDFIVFEPFASKTPFETWIMPKKHNMKFECMDDSTRTSFAKVLRKTLRAMYAGLSDPAYNFVICTPPVNEGTEDKYSHWYVEIVPRLTVAAGFEMGTGIYINVATPEDTASFLRDNIEK